MFSRIVVPLDGSEFGELALSTALGLARRCEGEVVLATVVTTLAPPQFTDPVTSFEQEGFRDGEEHARAYHRSVKKRIREAGIEVPLSTFVGIGPVVETLDQHVRDTATELLVISTHGRGPLMRAWLGSVADGLVRRTPCPVLMIRPAKGEQPSLTAGPVASHIVAALDGSTEAAEILEHAASLASATGARLSLLRVIPSHILSAATQRTRQVVTEPGDRSEEESAARYLSDEAAQLKLRGLDVETRVFAGAAPAEGILRFAKEASTDVIAMTTHGHGRIRRCLLGSVVDKVVRAADEPVLVFRSR